MSEKKDKGISEVRLRDFEVSLSGSSIHFVQATQAFGAFSLALMAPATWWFYGVDRGAADSVRTPNMMFWSLITLTALHAALTVLSPISANRWDQFLHSETGLGVFSVTPRGSKPKWTAPQICVYAMAFGILIRLLFYWTLAFLGLVICWVGIATRSIYSYPWLMINSITSVAVVFYAASTYSTPGRMKSKFNQWAGQPPAGTMRIPQSADFDDLNEILNREGVDLKPGLNKKDGVLMIINLWIIGLVMLVGGVPFLISGFGTVIGLSMIAFACGAFWGGAKFLSFFS